MMTTVESESESAIRSVLDEVLDEQPDLVRELKYRFLAKESKARELVHQRADKIEQVADWLENHIRIGDRPVVPVNFARDVYVAATGNKVEILEFIIAAFVAGYPVVTKKIKGEHIFPNGNTKEREKTYFVFCFNGRDIAQAKEKATQRARLGVSSADNGGAEGG